MKKILPLHHAANVGIAQAAGGRDCRQLSTIPMDNHMYQSQKTRGGRESTRLVRELALKTVQRDISYFLTGQIIAIAVTEQASLATKLSSIILVNVKKTVALGITRQDRSFISLQSKSCS